MIFFDHIICTQLNQRMYSNKNLLSIFSSSKKLDYTNDPIETITNIIKTSSNHDFLAILGTHYWGEHIEKTFKISLVDTQDKL